MRWCDFDPDKADIKRDPDRERPVEIGGRMSVGRPVAVTTTRTVVMFMMFVIVWQVLHRRRPT